MDDKKQHGVVASSEEYSSYDQVNKPAYRLAEQDPGEESFDEDFTIRICDLGRALRGDARDRAGFAQELGAAMEEIGFAILEGHGLDPQLFVDAAHGVEELFTSVPLEDKLRFRAARFGSVSEGYFPIQETSAIHPDLVEGWVFGRRAFDLDGEPAFDAQKLWPLAAFEPRFRRLVRAELPLFRTSAHRKSSSDDSYAAQAETWCGFRSTAANGATHGGLALGWPCGQRCPEPCSMNQSV